MDSISSRLSGTLLMPDLATTSTISSILGNPSCVRANTSLRSLGMLWLDVRKTARKQKTHLGRNVFKAVRLKHVNEHRVKFLLAVPRTTGNIARGLYLIQHVQFLILALNGKRERPRQASHGSTYLYALDALDNLSRLEAFEYFGDLVLLQVAAVSNVASPDALVVGLLD